MGKPHRHGLQAERCEGQQQHTCRSGTHPEAEHGLDDRDLAWGRNHEQRPGDRQSEHDQHVIPKVWASGWKQKSTGEAEHANDHDVVGRQNLGRAQAARS
jgi:hypothetical protein